MTAQLPAPNAKIAGTSEVIMYCGEQPDMTPEQMPNLLGLSYEIARIRAGWQNLFIRGEGVMINSNSILTVSQSIEEGQLVDPGTVITVTLADSSLGATART